MLRTKALITALLIIIGSLTYAQDYANTDIFPDFQKTIKYPAITPNGEYMVFLAEEDGFPVAYQSHFNGSEWSNPEPFEFINNLIKETKSEVGGFSFNHDGTVLFFHARINSVYSDIFSTEKRGDTWVAPRQVGKPVSMQANLFSPSISSDNKTLFVLREKASTSKHASVQRTIAF